MAERDILKKAGADKDALAENSSRKGRSTKPPINGIINEGKRR